MSLAASGADAGGVIIASAGSVRALQAVPEVLTPVRHGFLWKRSRVFKSWLSRWFQLDDSGFVYAVSPKVVKREGRYVLPSAVREVLPLPPQRYRNGATMHGIRVISIGGASKDFYTDDPTALDAWALDLSRSTPTARQAAFRKTLAAAPAAGGPHLPLPRRAAAGVAPGELRLSDICETDWSGMLGSGLFACVLRGRMHGTGEAVAVKVIKAEAMAEYGDIVQREAVVWSAVGVHPHIVALKQVLRSPVRMYFIAELCEGGSLVERLAGSATYCEREVAWLLRQLLAAVAHLHDNAIIHMDIKPENIVFASRREDSPIKLIDFSLASFFYSPTDPGGTPDFVAPELLNQPEHFSKNGCGPEVDMWAVGVMLFFLLSGQTPFQSPNLETVLQRVKSGEWAFHGRRWALVSEGARDLVSSLLRREPSQRLTAAEALDHPWLRRPESLSQALLQEAVVAFRSAASVAAQQVRTSWVKQSSGEMVNALLQSNMSLHTSLNRHAMMQAMGMGGNMLPTHMSTGGLMRGLMSTGGPMDGDGSGRPMGHGSAMLSMTASQHALLLQGGPSGRASLASRATGHTSAATSPNMPAVFAAAAAVAAAAAAAGGGGHGHGGLQHSFTAGGGAARHAASGLPSGPVGSGSLAMAVARSSGGSPHGSPHHSGAGTPRSPLGMRTRRASDTMAYAMLITERQESFTQMQAQGLGVPPNAGMQWPAMSSSKARRASDLSAYAIGKGPSPSASQADLSASTAAAVLAAASAATTHSAPGTSPGLGTAGGGGGGASGTGARQSHGYGGSGGYAGGAHQRGTSGLSVMTNASTAAAVAAARGSGRGGRSNPELLTMRLQSSSNGAPSTAGSSGETTPHSSARDIGTISIPSNTGGASRSPGGAAAAGAGRASWTQLPAPPPLHMQQQLQSASQASLAAAAAALAAAAQGQGQGQERAYVADGGDRALSRVSASSVRPGKSQSYNAIPSNWIEGQQGRPAGRGAVSGQGFGAPTVVAAGSGGGGAAGGAMSAGVGVAAQRRASMSFTAGVSIAGLPLLMPHGPSPLSNSSGGRMFVAGALATAGGTAGGGSGGMPTSASALAGMLPAGVAAVGPAAVLGRRAGSGSSTPQQPLSPSNSQSILHPFHVSSFASGGGSAGATAAAGASGSMYAAVLRSNLSGHGLVPDGSGGGGGGGGRRSDASTPASSSLSGSSTHGQVAEAMGSSVAAAAAPANILTSRDMAAAPAGAQQSFGGPRSGSSGSIGVAGRGADGAAAGCGRPSGGGRDSNGTRQMMEQMVLGPLCSSGSNAVSNSGWGVGALTFGSYLEGAVNDSGADMMAAAATIANAAADAAEAALSAAGPGYADSADGGRGSPGDGGRGASGGGSLPLRPLQLPKPPPPPLAVTARASSSSVAYDGQRRSAADGFSQPRFASGPQVNVVEVHGGAAAAAAASAMSAASHAAHSIADVFRNLGLVQRASSRLVLETIPSEDPDSLSGLLRSVREERMLQAGGGGGGGPGGGSGCAGGASSSGAGSMAVHAAILNNVSLPSASGAEPPAEALAAPVAALEAAAAIAAVARIAPEQVPATADLAKERGAWQRPNASPGSPGAVAELRSGGTPRVSSPLGSPVGDRARLGQSALRAFLSPQAGAAAQHGAPYRSTSLQEPQLTDPVVSGERNSGGSSGGSGGGGGRSPSGSSVGSGRGSGGMGRGGVRRAATTSNLRQHATTAAAAQAAAAQLTTVMEQQRQRAAEQAGGAGAQSPSPRSSGPASPLDIPSSSTKKAERDRSSSGSPEEVQWKGQRRASRQPTKRDVNEDRDAGPDPFAAWDQPPPAHIPSASGSVGGYGGGNGRQRVANPGPADPFAGWDYPPPAPMPTVPGGGGGRQRAASAVGLSGASLMALLAQAAPLAQMAQAHAALQIESIYSSSGGGSFSSQRNAGGGHYAGPGSIRAAGIAAGLGIGPDGGAGYDGSGGEQSDGFDGTGARSLRSGGGGSGGPRVRRATTAANVSLMTNPGLGGIAPAAGGTLSVGQLTYNHSIPSSLMHGFSHGANAGSNLGPHAGGQVPSGMSSSGFTSPVRAGGGAAPYVRVSGGGAVGGGGGGTLAALLAQAAPLAQAAQANAVAQAAARLGSASSTASASPTAGPYGAPRAAPGFSGPSTPTGLNTGGGSGGAAYFAGGDGAGVTAHDGPPAAPNWARRRSSTSKDLRDRSATLHMQLAGTSMVHRLGQGHAGGNAVGAAAAAAAAVAAGSASVGGVSGGGPLGGASGRQSQSPPREQGSPGGVSVSSTGRVSTYPAVPSRLSHSGTGTPTPRIIGSPAGSGAAGVGSPGLSPQTSLTRAGALMVAAVAAAPGTLHAQPSPAQVQAAAAAAQLAQLTQLHHLQNQLHQQSQQHLRVRTSRSGSASSYAAAGHANSRFSGHGGTASANNSGGASPSHSAVNITVPAWGGGGGGVPVAPLLPSLDKPAVLDQMEKEVRLLHGHLATNSGAVVRSGASSPSHAALPHQGGGGGGGRGGVSPGGSGQLRALQMQSPRGRSRAAEGQEGEPAGGY